MKDNTGIKFHEIFWTIVVIFFIVLFTVKAIGIVKSSEYCTEWLCIFSELWLWTICAVVALFIIALFATNLSQINKWLDKGMNDDVNAKGDDMG